MITLDRIKELRGHLPTWWRVAGGNGDIHAHDLGPLCDIAEERLLRPRVTVLCGSSRFCRVMAVCAWFLERDEGHVTVGLHLLPDWYPSVPDHHLAEKEGVADVMDALHLRKIDLADEVFVVNRGGYVGSSTANEVEYARSVNKTLRWYTEDPVGIRVEALVGEFEP